MNNTRRVKRRGKEKAQNKEEKDYLRNASRLTALCTLEIPRLYPGSLDLFPVQEMDYFCAKSPITIWS